MSFSLYKIFPVLASISYSYSLLLFLNSTSYNNIPSSASNSISNSLILLSFTLASFKAISLALSLPIYALVDAVPLELTASTSVFFSLSNKLSSVIDNPAKASKVYNSPLELVNLAAKTLLINLALPTEIL